MKWAVCIRAQINDPRPMPMPMPMTHDTSDAPLALVANEEPRGASVRRRERGGLVLAQ